MIQIKPFYTCAELAAFRIPGYPASKPAWRKLAQREGWYAKTRKANGGGLEYRPNDAVLAAIKTLFLAQERDTCPIEQKAAQHQNRKADRITVEAAMAAFAQPTTEAKQERRTAWMAVVHRWHSFYSECYGDKPRHKKKALDAFVAAFNARELGMDEWHVRVILRSSGRGRNAAARGLTRRTLESKLATVDRSSIFALTDSYHGEKRGDSLIAHQPVLQDYILGLLAHRPTISVTHLYELAEHKFRGTDVRLPSYSALGRYLARWKRQNAGAYLYLQNPDAWKNQMMPAVGDADGSIIRLNQIWELDSTMGDLLLSDGRRHAVIGVIDVYSRRTRLLVSPTSKSRSIGALVRWALLHWGVPEHAKTDNGQDYVSAYLTGVFHSLGIQHVLCPPFSPEYKPHIERVLGSFNHDLIELLPGYTGHDVAEAQAIRSRQSFASRLMQKDGVLEIRMSPEELQGFCDQWTENRYHHRPHAGLDGMTPFEKATAYRGAVRRVENERALDVLLSAPVDGRTRTLGKKGLEIHGAYYSDPELWRSHTTGDVFTVRVDETDLGRVLVFDETGFVCVAVCPQRAGLAPEEVRGHAMTIKRAASEHRKAVIKRLNEAKKGADLTADINGFLQSKAEHAAKLVAFPQPSIDHNTPALEAAAQASDALNTPIRSPEAQQLIAEAKTLFAAQRQPAEVIALPQKQEHPLDRMCAQELYQYRLQLDAIVAGGGELPDDERIRLFYTDFPKSATYKAQAAVRR